MINSSCFVTCKSAKKYEKSKNSFQPEKLLKTFLIVTRIITNMLYYTGKPTDLIESSTTITIYLEKLPWAFVFFPKNAIKLTSPKQQILGVHSFKRSWLFRHDLQKQKAIFTSIVQRICPSPSNNYVQRCQQYCLALLHLIAG